MKKRRALLAGRESSLAAASRREQMLDAAARHLNASGVSLTSLGDIAESLGVSRAALYQYVEDREDLVFQCYRRSCEAMARHLGEAIRVGTDAADVVATFIDRMLDPAQPEIAARAEIAFLGAERHEIIQGLFDAITTRLAGVLESGAQAGVLRPCDKDVNANAIISMVAWVPLARYWAEPAKTYAAERFTTAMKATLLDGLTTDKTVPPQYRPIDLSPLLTRVGGVFDRDAMADAKRETLLAIASRLFNSKGIDSTSLEEIASHVGATKRTLYHHLGDKQTLLVSCYARSYRIFLFIMESMTAYQGSRLDALAAAFHAISTVYLRDDLAPIAPMVGHEALPAKAQADMTPHSDALIAGYFGAMNQGKSEKSLHVDDMEARVLLLPGAFSWLVKDTGTHGEARIEHIAREISALLAMGLRKRSH